MGVENNEVVIATTSCDKCVLQVKNWISGLTDVHKSLLVFAPSLVNNKTTILLAPDGSKKGWDIAQEVESLRKSFIIFLNSFAYEDGSNPFKYVVVGYGDFGQRILGGNCMNQYEVKSRNPSVRRE